MTLENDLKGNFKHIHDKARLNIIYTGAWLVENFSQELKPFDLTEPQYNVLRVLRPQSPTPVSLHFIHERMVHKSCNTTRIVDKLVEKKLVTRETNPQNRRQIEIAITDQGHELLNKIYQIKKVERDDFKKKITQKEAEFLADILDRIRE